MFRKILVLGILFSFLALPSFAQSIDAGIKGGLNTSKITNVDGTDSKIGFLGGGFIASKFGPVGVQADFLFNRLGTAYEDSEFLGLYDERRTLHLDYLQVPVVAKFHLVPILNIHLGPYMGLLFNVSNDGDDIGKEDIKNADFGMKFGLGLEVSRLMFEARYGMGMVNIFNDFDEDYKNTSLEFTVGIKL